jgi:hypothetical protein
MTDEIIDEIKNKSVVYINESFTNDNLEKYLSKYSSILICLKKNLLFKIKRTEEKSVENVDEANQLDDDKEGTLFGRLILISRSWALKQIKRVDNDKIFV